MVRACESSVAASLSLRDVCLTVRPDFGSWATRRTVHRWLIRYANEGIAGLIGQSSKPDPCPHQIPAVSDMGAPAICKTLCDAEAIAHSIKAASDDCRRGGLMQSDQPFSGAEEGPERNTKVTQNPRHNRRSETWSGRDKTKQHPGMGIGDGSVILPHQTNHPAVRPRSDTGRDHRPHQAAAVPLKNERRETSIRGLPTVVSCSARRSARWVLRRWSLRSSRSLEMEGDDSH